MYYNFLTNCTLNEHLTETGQSAIEMEEVFMKEMANPEGVTEMLKATDTVIIKIKCCCAISLFNDICSVKVELCFNSVNCL